MNEPLPRSNLRPNREGRPLRRRGVSFNVLPRREESPANSPTTEPILVDYASIRQRKQLGLTDFFKSDNPVTFLLFTLWSGIRCFLELFILPFIVMKHLYLLMLKVYGVRRSTASTSPSDLFSISSSHSPNSQQQRPIVWILTVVDYIIFQLTRLPDILQQLIHSIRRHIDGTVVKSFHLIDTCTSHQLTRTFPTFKHVFTEKTIHSNQRENE